MGGRRKKKPHAKIAGEKASAAKKRKARAVGRIKKKTRGQKPKHVKSRPAEEAVRLPEPVQKILPAETISQTEKTDEEIIAGLVPEPPMAGPQAENAEKKQAHKFVILKNYPESRHYDLVRKNKGIVSSLLEKLGLKGGA